MPKAKDYNPSVKKAAAQLVRELPESTGWDDLIHEILVRQKIDNGTADIEAGRTHTHASVRGEFDRA